MNEKTFAAVSLSNRDFPSFEARLAEAAQWVDQAAAMGADLVVLPELLNRYRSDGEGSSQSLRAQDIAMADWQTSCAILLETAARNRIALTVPVLTREGDHLTNSFFLVGRDGSVLGRYQKMRPVPGEIKAGVQPGKMSLIEWEGLKIGGGICFDCYFPGVFQQQVEAGADLLLVPSLTAGGLYLNFYALHHSVPIVLAYPAWSRIIDVNGAELAAGGYRNETLRFGFGTPVITAVINFDRDVFFADFNQVKMNDVQRAYGPKVRITFDQPNALFIVESRAQDLSIHDIITRFGLVRRRDYFKNPEAHAII